MKIIVVEDDVIQNNNLSKIISNNYSDVEILKAYTVKEALEVVKTNEVDLFLIDVNLPDGSGIKLAENIRNMRMYELTGIVFVTNQAFQVIEAFKNTHCYDFLIKPYNEDDIKKILDVFIRNKKVVKEDDESYSMIPIDNKVMFKLYHQDIIYVEYMSRQCIIHTKKSQIVSKYLSLRNFLKEVESDYIMQTHKSFIVNIKFIEKIEKQYSKLWNIYFKNCDGVAALSLKYKDEVFKSLGDLNVYK